MLSTKAWAQNSGLTINGQKQAIFDEMQKKLFWNGQIENHRQDKAG